MGSITDIVVDGLKYPFNDVNKYLGFGVIQVIMSVLFMGAFASTGYYFLQAYKTSVLMGLDMIDWSVVSPAMIIVSAVLFVLGLIVFVYISGYEFNILKFSISKNNELPAFNDYVGMFKDGLKMIAVKIAYAILPGILFLLGLMLAVNDNVGAVVNGIGSFILAIAIIFAIVVAFFQIMAIARMVDMGTLRSAFDFREIYELISNMGVVQYVGILIFLAIAIAIINLAASAIFEIFGFAVALVLPTALASVFLVMILSSLLIDSFTSLATYRVYGSVYNVAQGNYDFNESETDDSQDSEDTSAADSEEEATGDVVDSEEAVAVDDDVVSQQDEFSESEDDVSEDKEAEADEK
ncbi:MAG: DUF4013 domain-containing protein [Methanobrevibacter sp.]|nr:DUF4013 domain-containing protein [Methanobrevibacter sp.]